MKASCSSNNNSQLLMLNTVFWVRKHAFKVEHSKQKMVQIPK